MEETEVRLVKKKGRERINFICQEVGCGREAKVRQMCQACYQRFRRQGGLDAINNSQSDESAGNSDIQVMPRRKPGKPRVNFMCTTPGCDREAIAKQLCGSCYNRMLKGPDAPRRKPRYSDVLDIDPEKGAFSPFCNVRDCEKPKYCKGVCSMHYQRQRARGSRWKKYSSPKDE